jgi:hypothetical protein
VRQANWQEFKALQRLVHASKVGDASQSRMSASPHAVGSLELSASRSPSPKPQAQDKPLAQTLGMHGPPAQPAVGAGVDGPSRRLANRGTERTVGPSWGGQWLVEEQRHLLVEEERDLTGGSRRFGGLDSQGFGGRDGGPLGVGVQRSERRAAAGGDAVDTREEGGTYVMGRGVPVGLEETRYKKHIQFMRELELDEDDAL